MYKSQYVPAHNIMPSCRVPVPATQVSGKLAFPGGGVSTTHLCISVFFCADLSPGSPPILFPNDATSSKMVLL